LSNLVATEQVETGDFVKVDFDPEKDALIFTKQSGKMIIADPAEDLTDEEPLSSADAVGLPLPQAETATGLSKSKGEHEI
jgi:hypothetical protein